ncbi:MAG: VOC family protein [Chloroflexi bacterium]|nr:VOC family protein [Chloroflexota bacterium]
MTFTRVHHVGMVVGDLEEARRVYTGGLGLAVDEHRSPLPGGRGTVPGDATALDFPIGEMFIEALKPKDASGELGKFLEERRGVGGMHHIALATSDFARDVRRLRQQGVALLPDRQGWDGVGSVVLDPKTTLGLLISVVPDEGYYVHPHYRGDGTVTGMAHIGIAARDKEQVRHLWEDVFGIPWDKSMNRDTTKRGLGPYDPVELVEFPVGGTVIEISIPIGTEYGSGKFVEQRAPLGAAYHHICPYAPNVHQFIEKAKAAGMQQLGAIPPIEQSRRATGWIHPKSFLGTLLEVWNRPPGAIPYPKP